MSDLGRYSRQMILPQVGKEGQERLKRARVLCVGAGGLGSPISLYLTAAGIGTLGLIDPDRVDESNLQRQILFGTSDTGSPKVEAARSRLLDLNPEVSIRTYEESFSSKSALGILSDYDLIIDGTDNFSAKFLINDAAVSAGVPLVFGSISQFEGQAAVFWAKHGPCYRCLYPEPPKTAIPNCAEAGVLGAVAGIIGSIQAAEAIKLILSREAPKSALKPLIGKLWVIDVATMHSSSFQIPKNPACPVCSQRPDKITLTDLPEACASSRGSIASITVEELQKLKSGPGPLGSISLVDVREIDEWEEGHIPGAIHFPLSRLEAGELPSVALKGCVVYCHSGIRSLKAIEILAQNGISGALNLRGGILAWSENKNRNR